MTATEFELAELRTELDRLRDENEELRAEIEELRREGFSRMRVDGGMYFIEDLDSTNYTYVNKQKLVPKTPQVVSDGDEIRLGRVSLIFKM